MGGRFESYQDNLTPREAEGPRGDETPGSLTASRYQRGEDGRGQGGGEENPPTARATRGQGPDGGDSAVRRGRTAAPDEVMEMAAGDGGAGHPLEHFDRADGARSKHGALARREYDNMALEASERGPASAGPSVGEEGHRATNHSAGQIWKEEGDENPKCASSAQETDGREMETRGPPERLRVPNASGRRGGGGGGGTPTQQCAPMARSEDMGGDSGPQERQRDPGETNQARRACAPRVRQYGVGGVGERSCQCRAFSRRGGS